MASEATITVRFVSDEDSTRELKEHLVEDAPGVTVDALRRAEDPTILGLDLQPAWDLIVHIPYAALLGPAVAIVLKVLDSRRPKGFVVITPWDEWRYTPGPKVSEAELREKFRKLTEIV